MSVARHYTMLAADGQAEALAAALRALSQAVLSLPGCLSVECLVDVDQAERFIFIERWESIGAHKSAGPLLPGTLMSSVAKALARKPEGAWLRSLPLPTSYATSE